MRRASPGPRLLAQGHDDGGGDEADAAQGEDAAQERRNLMEALLACARANATEGEIVAALQDVFGDYSETPVF